MSTPTNPARLRRDAERMLDLAARLEAGMGFDLSVPDEDGSAQRSLEQAGVRLSPIDHAVLSAAAHGGHVPAALRRLAGTRGERAELGAGFLARLIYPAILCAGVLAIATLQLQRSALPIALALLGPLAIAAAAGLWFWGTRRVAGGSVRWLTPFFDDIGETPYLEAMAELHGAGVGIVEAHGLASETTPVAALRARLDLAAGRLGDGSSYGTALDRANALATETRLQLATAEASGTLEDAFSRLARYRRERGRRRSERALRVLAALVYACAALAVLATAMEFYGRMFAGLR